jgi:hypothetical protein
MEDGQRKACHPSSSFLLHEKRKDWIFIKVNENTDRSAKNMEDDRRKRVHAIQKSMLESECVRSVFEEPGQDHLRCLIRLTVEFYDYLQIGNPGLRQLAKNQFAAVNIELDANDLDNQEGGYSIESIFSGIDSFASVTHTYSILIGATKSRIQWGNLSPQTLKVEFVAMFYDFELEVDFIKKCRLLLDLF